MILPEVLPYIWSAVSPHASVQKSLVLVSENMTGTENQKQSPVIISPLPHSVFSFSGSAGSDLTEQAQLQCQLTPILQKASLVYMNTNLSAAIATCTAMIFTWVRYGKPDVSMTLNGALAGLVAITAGCDQVSPVGAFFIGLFAGILLCVSVDFFDRIAKIDDPVGAISVHGACGAMGTLCVGLFATDGGLFYGGGIHYFLIQSLGVASVMLWVIITMTIIFKVIDKLVGLRVPADIEIEAWTITSMAWQVLMPDSTFLILLLRWM